MLTLSLGTFITQLVDAQMKRRLIKDNMTKKVF